MVVCDLGLVVVEVRGDLLFVGAELLERLFELGELLAVGPSGLMILVSAAYGQIADAAQQNDGIRPR